MNTYEEVWPSEEENPRRKFTREIFCAAKSTFYLAASFAVMLIYRRSYLAIIRIALKKRVVEN